MDAETFVEQLARMDEVELRAVAGLVSHNALSAEGELAWWRATTEVGTVLRAGGHRRRAAMVAHGATMAVLDAAGRCGLMATERELVTAVARAAADAARAMVADPEVGGNGRILVTPFRPLLCQPAH
jgi:hypothetical protein